MAIALLQGFGYYMICKNYNILEQQGIWPALVIIVSFVAGSSFVMWLGEQVNEFGVGNGISIILFAGILSRVPNMVTMGGELHPHQGLHRLPVDRAADRRHACDGRSDRPCQRGRAPHPRPVRQASGRPQDVRRPGIHPSHEGEHVRRSAHHLRADHRVPARHHLAFVGIPEEGTVGRSIYNAIDTKSVLYLIVYFLMIIGFSYFYATIQFNPVEISNNLKRNGGFIPGVKPGKATVNYIDTIMTRITLPGSIFLALVAILPALAMSS